MLERYQKLHTTFFLNIYKSTPARLVLVHQLLVPRRTAPVEARAHGVQPLREDEHLQVWFSVRGRCGRGCVEGEVVEGGGGGEVRRGRTRVRACVSLHRRRYRMITLNVFILPGANWEKKIGQKRGLEGQKRPIRA